MTNDSAEQGRANRASDIVLLMLRPRPLEVADPVHDACAVVDEA